MIKVSPRYNEIHTTQFLKVNKMTTHLVFTTVIGIIIIPLILLATTPKHIDSKGPGVLSSRKVLFK